MSDQQTVSAAVEQVSAAPKMASTDDEIQAMTTIYYALRNLDTQARYRVNQWVNSRLNNEQADDEEQF